MSKIDLTDPFPFEEENRHLGDWFKMISKVTSDDYGERFNAVEYFIDPGNRPSLVPLQYEKVKGGSAGDVVWEPIVDPNPALTHRFNEWWERSWEKNDTSKDELELAAESAKSPNVIPWAFTRYAFNVPVRDDINGISAGQVVGAFNVSKDPMLSLVQADRPNQNRIPQQYSALLARVLNALPGLHDTLFNTRPRGLNFTKCPFDGVEHSMNGRYIRISSKLDAKIILQLEDDEERRYSQFLQLRRCGTSSAWMLQEEKEDFFFQSYDEIADFVITRYL
jgi:hypothetical protein